MISQTHPVRPLYALVALGRLIRDPNDTEQAFRVVQALDGVHADRLFERFSKSDGGARLLAERPSLLDALSNRDSLAAMPEGSLGRAYLAFCDREGITPGGLVEASMIEERERLEPDFRYMADRLRDSHDLWHVVTGHRTDLLGELGVLAFSAAQTGSVGIGVLAAAGYLRSYRLPAEIGRTGRELVQSAWLRGKTAAWLPAVAFEELLDQPLDAVRARLGLGVTPSYAPLYAHELELLAAA